MAGKGTSYGNGVLELVLQNVVSTLMLAVGSGLQASATAGNLYLSLHTADPGPSGSQSTSEVSYTSYARAAVVRSASGWTVSTNTANLTSAVNFATCTGGSTTAAYLGIGTASSGTGNLLYSGAISPNISISNGVTPQMTTSTQIVEQ